MKGEMLRMKFKLFIQLFCINCILIRINAFPVQDEELAEQYSKQLDYFDALGDLSTDVIGPEAVSSSIREFQRSVGLNETGKLDIDTVAMMHAPGHQIKDNAVADSTRKKRSIHRGNKRHPHLTYRITKYPANLNDRRQVDRAIARGFKMWSDVAEITFEEKKQGDVNIDIRFKISNHGDDEDDYDFDGSGSYLEHASSREFGGNSYFDKQEKRTYAEKSGINKIGVPAHEFEDSFGLSHSKEKETLMGAPTYFVYQPTFVLHVDDIGSITALYGTRDPISKEPTQEPTQESTPKSTPEPTPEPSPEPTPEPSPAPTPEPSPDTPDLCQEPSIDAITRTKRGDTYVFKGDFYWKISGGIADGYPRKISDDWDGLEGNLDASVTFHGTTYFFKGRQYWAFTNKNMDSGYPRQISQGFRGLPDNLDAACVWSGNGQMYFFKGDHYWKFDAKEYPPVNRNYPTPIHAWKGLPNNLDACVLWDNNINYFFKEDAYYRFNDTRDRVDPQYPYPADKYWFGCDGNTSNRDIKK